MLTARIDEPDLFVAQRRIERLRGLGENPVLIGLRQARKRSARHRQQVFERALRGGVIGSPFGSWGTGFTDRLRKGILRRSLTFTAFIREAIRLLRESRSMP